MSMLDVHNRRHYNDTQGKIRLRVTVSQTIQTTAGGRVRIRVRARARGDFCEPLMQSEAYS